MSVFLDVRPQPLDGPLKSVWLYLASGAHTTGVTLTVDDAHYLRFLLNEVLPPAEDEE